MNQGLARNESDFWSCFYYIIIYFLDEVGMKKAYALFM